MGRELEPIDIFSLFHSKHLCMNLCVCVCVRSSLHCYFLASEFLLQSYIKQIIKMQAVKEKIQDMNVMRKVKAEAKAEEQVVKDIAKARMEVAHEVRLAKEAEAAMELHAAKAQQKAQQELAKHPPNQSHAAPPTINSIDDPSYT
ncbi:late embryogenesis abundant protein 6-like [Prosopis cineraria]|uniref:late embryogenesis abundant protein 6-like n=1 Tax=Prosopis cineraria TaxID=364024 RepID=UPI00240F1D24|nr:late embryogenesis abundant protein 6-like [Prosopis cineraria]